jgi:hypothetical protein
VLRRALAAILVATLVAAGAATSATGGSRATDGGHLWAGTPQLALSHGARGDLQTLEVVRARGQRTAIVLLCLLPGADPSLPPAVWLRSAWTGPRATGPRNLVPSNHRTRGPPGPGSSPIES